MLNKDIEFNPELSDWTNVKLKAWKQTTYILCDEMMNVNAVLKKSTNRINKYKFQRNVDGSKKHNKCNPGKVIWFESG